MAKGAAPEQQGGQDRSLDFLWLISLFVVGIVLAWHFGNIHITKVILSVKLYEMLVVKFVLKYWSEFAKISNLYVPNLSDIDHVINVINASYGSYVEIEFLKNLNNIIGLYIRIPVTIMLSIFSICIYFGSTNHFRRVYNMSLFKNEEQKNWPQISPVIKLDLIANSADDLPWAVSLDPMRFCKKYDLLQEERKKNGSIVVTLKKGIAYRVLSLQLGPQWINVQSLPDYLQALFAIFAARIDGNKKEAELLTDKISGSCLSGRIEFFNATSLLSKHANSKKVMKAVASHAYVSTVMSTMLLLSRDVGVFSTSEFVWLKQIDRRMWYVLNCVGRYTAFSEVAGVFAHWLAERKLGVPIIAPMIDEATKGLEIAISEMLYTKNED